MNGLSVVKLIGFIIHGKIKSHSNDQVRKLTDTYFSILDLEKCVRILRIERQVREGFYVTEVLKILRFVRERRGFLYN